MITINSFNQFNHLNLMEFNKKQLNFLNSLWKINLNNATSADIITNIFDYQQEVVLLPNISKINKRSIIELSLENNIESVNDSSSKNLSILANETQNENTTNEPENR